MESRWLGSLAAVVMVDSSAIPQEEGRRWLLVLSPVEEAVIHLMMSWRLGPLGAELDYAATLLVVKSGIQLLLQVVVVVRRLLRWSVVAAAAVAEELLMMIRPECSSFAFPAAVDVVEAEVAVV